MPAIEVVGGLGAGLLLGFLMGAFMWKARERNFGSHLVRGDALALLYDPTLDAIRVTPVSRIGEGLYSLAGGRGFLFVPKVTTSLRLEPFGRPAFFGVSVGGTGVAVDTVAMSKLGIAQIAMGSSVWGEIGQTAEEQLLGELLIKNAEFQGNVEISPDMRLNLAIRIPEIVTAFIQTKVQTAAAAVQALIDALQVSDKLVRLWLERERARSAIWDAILKWGTIILIVIAVAYIVVTQLPAGRVTPSP